MYTERGGWTRAPKEKLSKDRKITEAGLDYWTHELAEAFGFPELVPERDPDIAFYVATGLNSNGEIVGAKLLLRTPINLNADRKIRERQERMLMMRAKKVFGLIPQGNMG